MTFEEWFKYLDREKKGVIPASYISGYLEEQAISIQDDLESKIPGIPKISDIPNNPVKL